MEKELCPESRRSCHLRELPERTRNQVFALLVAGASVRARESTLLFAAVFELIFIIYFPPRDNVSLLRALKAISEFVVDRLLLQFINLFFVSPRTRLTLFCNSTFFFLFLSFANRLSRMRNSTCEALFFGMTSHVK